MLKPKVVHAEEVIKCWYEAWDGQVYVAFSGGLGSTVLLHLVRSLYPDVVAVFNNTGLEYPEIVRHVKATPNVVEIRPQVSFAKVVEKYGWPVISKEQSQFLYQCKNTKSDQLRATRLFGNSYGRGKISEKWKFMTRAPFKISDRCCNKLKKDPVKRFEKVSGLHPILGNMLQESSLRAQKFAKYGCNAYECRRPTSSPLTHWTQADLWAYIKQHNLSYSKIYDMGHTRTGCMFCLYGIHAHELPNKIQRMAETHPKQYEFIVHKMGAKEVLDFIGVPYK